MHHTMSVPFFSTLSFFCFFLFIFAFPFFAQGVVPSSQTFNFVNEGEFGVYIVEYDANYRPLSVFSNPFQLCFYNTTPGAYMLALRMGTARSESLRRWVWEANRGNPVGENATFALGSNGNLILANADGKVAWQSNTVGKDVVGFRLLPNGNMVLYDSKGKFVWQSFDSPTDTLLVGQSLRLKGPNKLVSRLSRTESKNGPYSLSLEPNKFKMYYMSKNSPKPMIYFNLIPNSLRNVTLDVITFNSTEYNLWYELRLEIFNTTDYLILSMPKYNSTLTYLRLGIDGGLRAYTYDEKFQTFAWEETFTLFPRAFGEECRLPERCGSFGLCEDSQCVACPSPNGLLGWSSSCEPPKLTSCKANEIKYYKFEGVEHFTTKYTSGNGPMKEEECLKKCTSDCKCLGFFFDRAESRCWMVYDLKTLIKVENSMHVGYIKAPIR